MGPAILGPHRRLAKLVDIAAIKLHAQRRIRFAGLRKFHGAFVFPQNAFRAEEIRASHANAAARARDETKAQIAVPGDGGEQQIRRQLHFADL